MGGGVLQVCLAVDESPKPGSVFTYRPFYCLVLLPPTRAAAPKCYEAGMWEFLLNF